MNKIGLNWSTLEYKTKKSLVLIISRIYRRLSPVLLLDTIISLSEINCTPDEIEKISKELKIEFYLLNAIDNKDTDLNIMRNVENNNNSSLNSPLSVHGIKSVLTIQGNSSYYNKNNKSKNIYTNSCSNFNKNTDNNYNYDNKKTDLNIMRNIDNNSISSLNSPLSVHGIKSVLTIQGNDNTLSQKEDLIIDSNNIHKIEDNYIESDDNQIFFL